MSDIDTIIDKISQAYQPINKTVSDLGSSINKTEKTVIRLETKFDDYIENVNKMLDSHDKSIKALDTAKTTIFSSVKTMWLVIPTVVILSGYIVNQWRDGYDQRLKTLETERKQAYEQFIKILSDKKNYLNQESIKNIFANL